ncbi:hypothetical protein [Campylobacter vulpis]|uniref:hypothetical protein n=1 Tax=Campylobacter vulpis TaxID=1655500 RepID=UPI001BD01F71|nr:hypothetical protein [Campylobacter vulpis]MBS4407234.1 hypothetical protein [Campylobacter vulpis]
MKEKMYEVKIYYSGFCTYEVVAKDENGAVEKARKLPINEGEILSNLENWKEADEAFEIKGQIDVDRK